MAVAAAMACSAALAPSSAAAQDEEASPPATGQAAPREAIELYQRAREHYRNGRYEAAIQDLDRALVLDPGSPTLLYNLARVYELWSHHDQAIRAYQNYLRVLGPEDEAERERTEAAIVRLRGAREYVRADESAYSQTLYVSQRGVADDAFWITAGVGAALALGGGGLAVATAVLQRRADDFVLGQDGGVAARLQAYDDVTTTALVADIVGGTGGAALLTAALLWVLREESVEMYPDATPVVSIDVEPRGGAMLSVRGAF